MPPAASRVSPQQFLTTLMIRVVVDKSTSHAKPDSIRFLPQYQNDKKEILVRISLTRT